MPAGGLVQARQTTNSSNGQPAVEWSHLNPVGVTESGLGGPAAYDPLGNYAPLPAPPPQSEQWPQPGGYYGPIWGGAGSLFSNVNNFSTGCTLDGAPTDCDSVMRAVHGDMAGIDSISSTGLVDLAGLGLIPSVERRSRRVPDPNWEVPGDTKTEYYTVTPNAASSASAGRPRQVDAPLEAASKSAIEDHDGVVEDDGAAVWKPKELQAPGKKPLDLLQFNDAEHGWAASEEGDLYKTADGGKTWEPVKIEVPPDSRLMDLYFSSPLTGWVVLSRYELGGVDSKTWLYSTRNGGESWQAQYESNELGATRLVFFNEREGWLAGVKVVGIKPVHQTHAVLHTSDQGRSWEDVSEELNRKSADNYGRVQDFVRDIVPTGPNRASLITRSRSIYSTNDGGKSWQPVTAIQDEPPQTCMCNLGVIDNNNFWIGGGADSQEGMWGTLVRVRNGSLNRYRTDGVYFRDILHTSGEQFLASGSTQKGGKEAGAILFTPDGGRRWKLLYRTTNVKIINCKSQNLI